MRKSLLLLINFIFICGEVYAQPLTVSCTEKEKKNLGEKDPIIVNTCLIRNFKFVDLSYPDYAGRYFYSEQEVYVLTGKKYIKTVNSHFFNEHQDELLSFINTKIQADFKRASTDSVSRDCFTGLDSIPKYEVNDFRITFHKDEIWFEIDWGLPAACRFTDGTIVSFKLAQIRKYVK